MKKYITVIVLFPPFLLSSCSFSLGQLFPVPTMTPAPKTSPSPTASGIPTVTPTVPTATYTVTPTLAGQLTPSPTLDFTPTAFEFTPFNLATLDTLTPSVVMEGFVSVLTSTNEFFKKGGCEPTTVKFTATAADPARTAIVVLFVRFKSKQTGTTSEWTNFSMPSLIPGTFVYELIPDDMKAVNYFKNAWVQYQFVATDTNARQIGRTEIFAENLTLSDCVPTPTPTVGPPETLAAPK